MTSILGLDISSFQINACLLENSGFRLATYVIGKQGKDTLVDRLRRIPHAIESACRMCGSAQYKGFADFVVVEEPFGGKNVPKALLMTAGACLANVTPPARPWLITPGDWRASIGAKNTKPAGHEAVYKHLEDNWGYHPNLEFKSYTHDELDAIGIALGARRILEAQTC